MKQKSLYYLKPVAVITIIIVAIGLSSIQRPSPPQVIHYRTSAVTLVGAGDIASCDVSGDEETAQLIGSAADVVFTLGDNLYGGERKTDFDACFAWSQFKNKIRPAAGNH